MTRRYRRDTHLPPAMPDKRWQDICDRQPSRIRRRQIRRKRCSPMAADAVAQHDDRVVLPISTVVQAEHVPQ